MRIGFQGTPFSYSHKAAKQLAAEYGLDDAELVPLETSGNVRDAIFSRDVDYGVVAQQNSVGGTVRETNEIFLTDNWVTLHRCILEINHCLFVKDRNVGPETIRGVASHEQALRQCQAGVDEMLGKEALRVECPDTAKAAAMLAEGILDRDTAVICSKEAGQHAGLVLLREGIQDHKDNRTEFALIRLREKQDTQGGIRDKLLKRALSRDATFTSAVKYALIFAVLSAWPVYYGSSLFLPANLALSLPSSVALMAGGGLLIVEWLNAYRRGKSLELLSGYWVYMDKVSSGLEDNKQSYTIPRAVVMDVVNGTLRIRGWICEKPPRPYFEAREVFHSSPFSARGSLIYKYSNYANENDWSFNGVVSLEWSKSNPEDVIDTLSGRYYGFLTNSYGGLLFHRISPEKFWEICPISASVPGY